MHEHRITADPGGRPVIAGTQVTVETVLTELATWGEIDRLLTAHPELDRDAVHAALAFAAEHLPVLEPARAEPPPAAAAPFTPRTPFGQEMWALHQAVVAEAKHRGEPMLETWEDVAREVRERRGERTYGEDEG
jgi:uncharacterized protein (DUF433 family)